MTTGKRINFCVLVVCILLTACGQTGGNVITIGGSDENTVLTGERGTAAGAAPGETGEKETVQAAGVYVYVCGSVKNPGVFVLAEGSRVSEALEAAGGYAEDADREFVNLAAKVTDGQKLYFPAYGEKLSPSEEREDDGLVNINTASVEELCKLPGIGESRAADIISYRESTGGFKTCEDIMKVSGIKTSVYNKIKDKIKVD